MSEASSGPRPRGPEDRPMSPHVTVWRWHITMVSSILHRVSGVALYVGALILAGGALSLACGPDAYAVFRALMAGFLGRIALFGLTLAIFYHLAHGIRHLVWDAGVGFTPKTSDATAVAEIAFTVVATVVAWSLAYATGAF
jgi:succinate dehydrogenase / fumarate reductase cytochrome b subunit